MTVFALTELSPPVSGQTAAHGFPSQANGEWSSYNSDIKGSRYMPFDQINASNFNQLEIAFRFKTDNLGPRLEYKLEGTPLMVGGTLYMTGGTRRSVVALDARTGEQKWVYGMDEGRRAEMAPRVLSGRGLSYWTDGKGDERIVYVTIGYRLVQLNARNGQPITTFGKNGVVDLKDGVVYGKKVNGKWQQVQIPLVEGEIGTNSTPLVVGDIIVVQSAMAEGLRYEYTNNSKGLVRAYDARTGKQLWRFDTMPGPGQPGHETWENGSWNWTGNTGVWTEMSADPDAGLLYLPVESPTIDGYGGHRPGQQPLCREPRRRRLEDRQEKMALPDHAPSALGLRPDRGAAPDGRHHRRQAAQDRGTAEQAGMALRVRPHHGRADLADAGESGAAVRRARGEDLGRHSPSRPSRRPISRNYLAADDVIDFTPELRAQALVNLKKFRWEQTPFVPYSVPNDKVLGSDPGRQHDGRRQLAGLVVQSRDGHLLHPGQ